MRLEQVEDPTDDLREAVYVQLRTHNQTSSPVHWAAREVPEIIVIQTLLGRVDVRMDVVARDLSHYQEILKGRIMDLPHIADIEALMRVSEIKNDPWIAI